ncbi:hypothetical protein [Dyella sp. 20L07]|uniref:hypothetical protein n=1 Tax=Dyella sp. 20L07 TaxID=3384240 RepID=UPI003D2C2E35
MTTLGAHKIRIALVLAMLCASLGSAPTAKAAPVDLWDGDWHYSISPYGWLPGVTADLRFKIQNQSVNNNSDNNILDHLNGAFMLSGEARKGDWGIYSDIDWVKFDNQDGRVSSIGGNRFGATANLNTRWGMKGGMVNLAGLYNIGHGDIGYADVLFGVRYLWIKANLGWNFSLVGNGGNLNISDSGHHSQNTTSTDAIVGIKGRWTPFRNNWYFPYYLDVGGGSSNTSWQGNVGIGYAFSWGDLALGWRYIQYKQTSSSDLLQKVRMSGPAFSFNWTF